MLMNKIESDPKGMSVDYINDACAALVDCSQPYTHWFDSRYEETADSFRLKFPDRLIKSTTYG